MGLYGVSSLVSRLRSVVDINARKSWNMKPPALAFAVAFSVADFMTGNFRIPLNFTAFCANSVVIAAKKTPVPNVFVVLVASETPSIHTAPFTYFFSSGESVE